MTYSSISVYPVPEDRVAEFLAIRREARAIAQGHGCLEEVTWVAVSDVPEYGHSSFAQRLSLSPGERVLVGVSSYRNREHHDEVMGLIEVDERAAELDERMVALLDVARVARAEFEQGG